jgi:hypothetical protein
MKTQSELKAYAAELSAFKTSECSCKTCRGLCSMVPCMGTPQEIKAIIDSGRINILNRKWHLGTACHGMPPLDCVMVRAVAIGNGCSQFDGQHCALHHTGLKPSEGKFANHSETHSSFWAIAATWFLDENAELVAWLRGLFPEPEPLDDNLQRACKEFANLVNGELAKMENPGDFAEREEISVLASRQFQKFIRMYQEAQAVARAVEMLRNVKSFKVGGVQIEIISEDEAEEKTCGPVSV